MPSATAAPTGAASSSARVSRGGGLGQVNYELDRSKTSWHRVKEMESLSFFPVGCGRATGAETSPRPDDEVFVFESLFVAGLRLPFHDFLIAVLDKFKVQIHQLTPNVVVALSKFIWATTTFSGDPSTEVFAKHYCLHWQKRAMSGRVDQFGSCTFTLKTGKTKEKVAELAPCAKNKWVGWMEKWFYVRCTGGGGWPRPSTMSPFEFEAFPRFTVDDRGRRDHAFRIDTRTCSGRDLVEEFLVCGVRLLSRGWTIGVVARIDLDGFDRQIFSSTFTVDLGDCSYELFVAETEMEAKDLVGLVTDAELEKGAALRGGYDRVNRVFILMGLEYEEHKAKPKRGSRTSTGVLPSRKRRLRLRRSARRR
jgi:hypothetical protein